MRGDPRELNADAREASTDGKIYVLDDLASEIRAFDASGAFLHTGASPGEGPGKISEAKGMILVGHTILWVQDHSKWMMIGLSRKVESWLGSPCTSAPIATSGVGQ